MQHESLDKGGACLVNLSPTCFDSRYIEQNGAVLPKWTLFDIVDETNSTEVHVALAFPFNGA